MCQKHYFMSEELALKALASAIRRSAYDDRRRECAYYYCTRCFYYHLTSKPQNPSWKQKTIDEKLDAYFKENPTVRIMK